MAAKVTFLFNAYENKAIVIPAKAVGEDSKGRFVFLIEEKEGGKAFVKKQYIEIGSLQPHGFEVKNGLILGQKIAVAGLQTLLEGQEVKLQN